MKSNELANRIERDVQTVLRQAIGRPGTAATLAEIEQEILDGVVNHLPVPLTVTCRLDGRDVVATVQGPTIVITTAARGELVAGAGK